MKGILSTAMERRFYLLHLLHNSTGWVSIEKITAQEHASKKTIMSDLEFLQDTWPDRIAIEYQEKFGVRLVQSNSYSIHDIYREIVRESSGFKLLEGIFFDPNQNIAYWKNHLYLSDSSLYRLTSRLQEDLNSRGMTLTRTPHRVLGGNERHVQIFFQRSFWEAYGLQGWPFPFDRDAVNQLVEKFNQDFHWNHEAVNHVDIAFAVCVSLIRSQQGYEMLEDTNLREEHQSLIAEMERYKPDIEKIISPLGYTLSDTWKENFVLTVFWWEFAWDNRQEMLRLQHLALEFIDTVVAEMEFTIDSESRLKIHDSIIKHYMRYKVYPYPRYSFYDRNWFGSHVVQQYSPEFKEVVEKGLKKLEEQTRVPLYTMYFDNIFVMMAAFWKDLSPQINRLKKPVTLAVFSDLGMYHAESLGNYLKTVYQDKVIIEIQPASVYNQKNCPQPTADIYVANFTMTGIPKDKLFVVEDIPSHKNLIELQKKIYNGKGTFLKLPV